MSNSFLSYTLITKAGFIEINHNFLGLIILRFPVDENCTMKSVIEYFQEMYGFTIQHTHLPCLQVGNQKKASYLPMEVKNTRYSYIAKDFNSWLFYFSSDSILYM